MDKQLIKLMLKLLEVGDNKVEYIMGKLQDELTDDTIEHICREVANKGW